MNIPHDHLLTAREIGSLLRVRTDKVYRIMANWGVPCIRVGARVRYDPGEFERALKAQKDRRA